jgi:hypothetical protein
LPARWARSTVVAVWDIDGTSEVRRLGRVRDMHLAILVNASDCTRGAAIARLRRRGLHG